MYHYKALKIKGKRIDEHRFIMQNHIGRKLEYNEVVHHINGDKLDNRIENLEIVNRSEHSKYHYKTGETKDNLVAANKSRERKTKIIDGETHYECCRCRLFLPESNYHKSKLKKHGIRHLCKKCVYDYQQRYR